MGQVMSDISMVAREAALDSDDDRLETVVSLDDQLWLRQMLVAAATGIGVAVSAALSVAIFLR
jgi:hypothetical protein